MKKSAFVFFLSLFFLLTVNSYAQYKNDAGKPDISGILNAPKTGYFFGLIDPSKMQMHHSASLSYGTFGSGSGMALSSYVNTIDYQVTDRLFLRTNLGIVSSPYNNFNSNFFLNKPQFFGGAQLLYKLNNNTQFMLQIQTSPFLYSPGFGNNVYYNPFR